MDRLPAVIAAAALAAAGCDDRRGDAPAEPASRVNGAKVEAQRGATAEAFCDVYKPGDTGPAFAWPALADGAAAPAAPGGAWRWINVWATYCKPCLDEMPRLVAWRDQLAKARAIELAFVSIDEAAATVATFRAAHPQTPASVRLGDPAARAAWWKALGLDGEPPIPINLFVTPSGHVRCARAGGIRDQDRPVVEKLFAEP